MNELVPLSAEQEGEAVALLAELLLDVVRKRRGGACGGGLGGGSGGAIGGAVTLPASRWPVSSSIDVFVP